MHDQQRYSHPPTLTRLAPVALGRGHAVLLSCLMMPGAVLAESPVAAAGWSGVVGIGIVLLVLLQSAVLLAGAVRRFYFERKVEKADLEVWDTKISRLLEKTEVKEEVTAAWQGIRKFEVKKKVEEGGGICSFYLSPHDKRALPAFKPGQYLTFNLDIPGQSKAVVRCYSLSDKPMPDYYRVSIKRVPPPRDKPELPPGLSSSYFHDNIREGDILDVKTPSGGFFLDTVKEGPVVLIGGGIGLTPVLSMLNTLSEANSRREIWMFYGVRNSREHVMREELRRAEALCENARVCVCYSAPLDTDVEGEDYTYAGRVSVGLFKEILPSNNYSFYICGPGPMMNSIVEGLKEWDVPEEDIHFEAFGPASVKKPRPAVSVEQQAAAEQFEISFEKSGRTFAWDGKCDNLLEFAEQNGVVLDSGCRAGNCGTCLIAVKSGDVEYVVSTDNQPEKGSCLTCCSVPRSNLVLDA